MENPRQINAGGGEVKTDRIAETRRRTRELVERLINKRYYSGKGKERGGNGEGQLFSHGTTCTSCVIEYITATVYITRCTLTPREIPLNPDRRTRSVFFPLF